LARTVRELTQPSRAVESEPAVRVDSVAPNRAATHAPIGKPIPEGREEGGAVRRYLREDARYRKGGDGQNERRGAKQDGRSRGGPLNDRRG
jgi:hypothetical protein